MDKAIVDGTELEYEVIGTGEPVILIHGALIADAFRPLVSLPSLTERYRLILYHRRGYAGSGPASHATVASEAADCRELLRHLNIGMAHVAGHSYGGVVALQLALDAPTLVHSLALLEPALMVGKSAQGYRDSLEQGSARYQEIGAEPVVHAFMEARWPGYRPVIDRLLPGAFEQAVADAPTTLDSELPRLLAWTFGEAEARRVTQPVLSVLGGESGLLSPRFGETHEGMLASMSDAEGAVVFGTTHLMQIQDPRATAEALASFWERHPMPSA